jgi:hypothetical protein
MLRSRRKLLQYLKSATKKNKKDGNKSRKPQKSRKQKIDGGGNDTINDIHDSIRFFKNEFKLLPAGEDNTILPTTEKLYKEFFTKFSAVNVTLPVIESVDYNVSHNQLFEHINPDLRASVDSQMITKYTCTVEIGKPISITISVSDNPGDIKNINTYFTMIIFWLHIVSQYATDKCSLPLSIYIMLSNLKKKLPAKECSSNCEIKNTSVNTGYSTKCRHIVIYRKEEWFKVFIHETIHNYGLDFSFLHQEQEEGTKNIFGITTKNLQIRLYEAYTESLARMINAMIIAFDAHYDNQTAFIKQAHENIQLERMNAYFQTCKIIKYLNMDDYLNPEMTNFGAYTEDTSNLSYYFIVCILYSDFQKYIQWLYTNNTINVLQFNPSNQEAFVSYISQQKRTSLFQDNIKYYMKTYFADKVMKDNYLYLYMRKSLLERTV